VLRAPGLAKSRASTASRSTSASGYASEISRVPAVSVGSEAIGRIRNVHDNNPRPVVTINASIRPVRSRPPVRLRIMTSNAAASSG
jgi:hypothetical protein